MSTHDNKLLLLIKTKGRIANISCHVCAVARLSGGHWSSIQLQPVGQPGWEPCHCLRQDDPLCAFQEGCWAMILSGLGLGNHPSLKRDATFQNFTVFYVLGFFFLNESWSLGCTETAHASPSAGTSWFCIIQGHFL